MMAALTLPELLSWAREQAAEVLAGFASITQTLGSRVSRRKLEAVTTRNFRIKNFFRWAIKLFSHP
jgi:hypothetical protein